jgi:threonine/homoserine/homoserine lactone efflux protein
MPSASTLAVFLLASYGLAIVPGPAVVYIVNRSLSQGRRAGVVSALGIAIGGSVHVLAAAVGISAVLASSAVAFAVVKYAGAAYLIFLGFRALRSDGTMIDLRLTRSSLRRILTQGVVVNVLNPKTALFFLSFFPQFIDPEAGPILPQMLILGSVFIAAALSSDLLYAVAAGTIREALERRPGLRGGSRWVTAGIFFGLGAASALAD